MFTKLDKLWEQVNSLGGQAEESDEYARGVNETVSVVLDIIEKAGGIDPALRTQPDVRGER